MDKEQSTLSHNILKWKQRREQSVNKAQKSLKR